MFSIAIRDIPPDLDQVFEPTHHRGFVPDPPNRVGTTLDMDTYELFADRRALRRLNVDPYELCAGGNVNEHRAVLNSLAFLGSTV